MSDDTEVFDTHSADAGAEPAETDEQHGETSAPEDEAQDAQENGEEQESETEGDKPAAKDNPVQKRINEITRARRAAEAENAALRRMILESQQARAERQAPPQAEATPEEQAPKESDFQDYGAYQRAMVGYEARQQVRAEIKAEQARQQSAQQQTAQARAAQESQQRQAKLVEDGRAKFDDFDEVALGDHARITPIMAEALSLEDKSGPEIAYYLGKKPDEAARIAALPPARQIMEIGRLAERIQAAGKKTVSKATPPIKPVSGARASSVKDPSKMTMDEYAAYRDKQERARR
jgi:hypothetical protein